MPSAKAIMPGVVNMKVDVTVKIYRRLDESDSSRRAEAGPSLRLGSSQNQELQLGH